MGKLKFSYIEITFHVVELVSWVVRSDPWCRITKDHHGFYRRNVLENRVLTRHMQETSPIIAKTDEVSTKSIDDSVTFKMVHISIFLLVSVPIAYSPGERRSENMTCAFGVVT